MLLAPPKPTFGMTESLTITAQRWILALCSSQWKMLVETGKPRCTFSSAVIGSAVVLCFFVYNQKTSGLVPGHLFQTASTCVNSYSCWMWFVLCGVPTLLLLSWSQMCQQEETHFLNSMPPIKIVMFNVQLCYYSDNSTLSSVDCLNFRNVDLH